MEFIQLSQWLSYKGTLGLFSVLIMLLGYGIYLRQTYLKQVLPHPLSWFLFASTTFVTYSIQVLKGAGPGSWVMGLTALMCFALFIYSWYRGGRLSYSSTDWVFFAGALVVLGCYVGTVYVYEMDPTISAIVATLADVLAYGPTIWKGWSKPHDDSVTSFFFNSAKFIPSLAALGPYASATHLLPATLVIVNAGVAIMLLLRRRKFTLAQQHT